MARDAGGVAADKTESSTRTKQNKKNMPEKDDEKKTTRTFVGQKKTNLLLCLLSIMTMIVMKMKMRIVWEQAKRD